MSDVLDYFLCDLFLFLRGWEVRPHLRAGNAAASGSVYAGEATVRTSRKSERRRQFAVAIEEETRKAFKILSVDY